MGSVQGSGIQTGGWRAFLDEVSQDLEDLRGVGDYGNDLHGFVTTRAGQGAPAVRFAARSGWMVALPALGSEAEEVRATGPHAASPRGVQPVRAYESASRIRQETSEDLDRPCVEGKSAGLENRILCQAFLALSFALLGFPPPQPLIRPSSSSIKSSAASRPTESLTRESLMPRMARSCGGIAA